MQIEISIQRTKYVFTTSGVFVSEVEGQRYMPLKILPLRVHVLIKLPSSTHVSTIDGLQFGFRNCHLEMRQWNSFWRRWQVSMVGTVSTLEEGEGNDNTKLKNDSLLRINCLTLVGFWYSSFTLQSFLGPSYASNQPMRWVQKYVRTLTLVCEYTIVCFNSLHFWYFEKLWIFNTDIILYHRDHNYSPPFRLYFILYPVPRFTRLDYEEQF